MPSKATTLAVYILSVQLLISIRTFSDLFYFWLIIILVLYSAHLQVRSLDYVQDNLPRIAFSFYCLGRKVTTLNLDPRPRLNSLGDVTLDRAPTATGDEAE